MVDEPQADRLDEEEEVYEAPLKLQRPREDSEMDITPMIDITFLLLIFFLVAAKLEQPASVDLPPARHGGPVAARDSVVILVKKGSADQAIVARGDGTPFSSDLDTQEEEIGSYVIAGFEGSPPFTGVKHHLMIKAERGVKHGDVDRVAKAIGQVADQLPQGLPQLHLAVLENL